jgi:two-component system, chemotaxis family, CheB/CheR fusion protein
MLDMTDGGEIATSAVLHEKSDFLIVGLGGSAGSIPSFREFFRHVPPDSGMAYVVILHLSPEYESHLAEVLQATASIPVMQVREQQKVEPNHVYVIPPNQSLALSDSTLVLSEMTGFAERRAPVDIFFRTLADTHESRAVCVVMSGTGADGSMGLRRVKEYNGLVLVQDPAEAQFGEMPRNSIATGLADFVLPAAEMCSAIVSYRNQVQTTPLAIDERSADEHALLEVFGELRSRTGQDFANYKRATVLRRIERRLAVRGLSTLQQYARCMRTHPDEADALLRELLISVTNFFRDRHVFERLEQLVIPKLLHNRSTEDHVRVWIPGCATGEEAYSIAMLLADATANLPYMPNVQIFATDLDEAAIARARAGFYSEADTADVPPDRLRRYFVKEQNGFRIRRELRELVLFAHHNLIKDPPFSHLDFVSCRNLLIYLNVSAQQRVIGVLHFALKPGGYLLLGTAESVDAAGALFATFDKDAHIFQSRIAARTVTMPTPRMLPASLVRPPAPATAAPPVEGHTPVLPMDLHQSLLEAYAPPSLIIDEQHSILHLSPRAGRYLQFAAGEASLNVLQVVRPELRIDLRTALLQAAQKRTTVAARRLSVQTSERAETIDVIVHPVLRDDDSGQGLFLVLFEESRETVDVAPPAAVEPAARQLEEELIRLKGQMRVRIEQYEVQVEEAKAANEELQAMNEELRSTAEELETSQEELQSVNEELQTVNQELKVKIEEISQANNNMRNLMSSTEIGTIFVDRGLRVKLFTPPVTDIFNLIPADIGRPLLDINSRLIGGENLNANIERVLDRLHAIEQEVETRDGLWYLMRMVPYRTAEDRIEGVVLTFVEITKRLRAEKDLRRSREELEHRVTERTSELSRATSMLQAIIDSSPISIIAFDRERNVITWNPSAERMFGITAAAALGKPLPEFANTAVLFDLFNGSTPRTYETIFHRADGSPFSVSVCPAPLLAPDGTVYAVMGLLQDTTDRNRMEQERDKLLRRIVSSQEEERQRIARELHDVLGQHLTALKVGLEALLPASDSIERMKEIVSDLDRSVDRLTLELRPPALDDVGLAGAISSLLDQFSTASGIRADLHTTGTETERLPSPIETSLYRVLQEALTNVWKHASAKSVSVIVERNPQQVQLIIEDDGRGFEVSDAPDDIARGRFGLLGITERVSLVGGTFNVESTPGKGTTLYVRVPLAKS